KRQELVYILVFKAQPGGGRFWRSVSQIGIRDEPLPQQSSAMVGEKGESRFFKRPPRLASCSICSGKYKFKHALGSTEDKKSKKHLVIKPQSLLLLTGRPFQFHVITLPIHVLW